MSHRESERGGSDRARRGQIGLHRAQLSVGLRKRAGVAAKDRTFVPPLCLLKAVVHGHPHQLDIVADDQPL